MALLGEPRLLLLDEPCAGLSPQETAEVIDVIRWASERRGATIVVIEHDMSLVRKLADHVFVLHNGRLLAEGSVAEVQAERGGPGDLCGRREMSSRRRLDSARPRSRSSGLAGGYGDVVVVRGVSGAVAAGEVLCVIGRNGVGKSTLLKMLFGQLPCREGSVRFEGRAIERVEASQRRALGISYCPQERPVFDDLSVRDNLTLMRADRRLDAFAPLFARFPILEAPAGAARRHAVGRREEAPVVRAWPRPRRSRCCCSTSRAKACNGRTSCTWPS